jgi:hypothetical protein
LLRKPIAVDAEYPRAVDDAERRGANPVERHLELLFA